MSSTVATVAMAERIRVLKFMTVFGLGGTEKQAIRLACSLDRAQFELAFGCLERRGELLAEVERQRIPVHEYPISSFFTFNALKQQWRFARAVRALRIDVVHSYNFYANVFSVPAARLAGVPCVLASIRDTGVYLDAMQRRVLKHACSMAHHLVANSEAVRRWLTGQGHPESRISVIRNGLDVGRYALPRNRSTIRRELGLPSDAPLVLMLARLNPQKGVAYFIEAAASLAPAFPDARFLIVGGDFERAADAAYRAELERLAGRLGVGDRVVFTGFRSDVPELLAETAVSVLPSLSEGFSNTVLESMAAGVPVVATRVGGTPEMIEHDRDGLLVPPRDTRALAEAIGAALGDPALAARLGGEARRRAARCFSFDKTARETEALYLRLLAHTRRKRHAT